jgi:hypothetical protein
MRAFIIAAIVLYGSFALAEPNRRYDVFILDYDDAPDTFAFTGAGRMAAVSVDGCKAELLTDPGAQLARIRDLREARAVSTITVDGHGVRLGSCTLPDEVEEEDPEDVRDDNRPSLVIIKDSSARQTRTLLNDLDALSPQMRDEMRQTLGL